MRIVLFTVDDVDFLPTLLDPLLDKHKDHVVHAYVSNSFPNPLAAIKKYFFFFIKNYYPFCIKLSDLFRYASGVVNNKLKKEDGNIYDYLKGKGVNATEVISISTKKFREELAELNPDICLFATFDKIAGPKFLAIPKVGSLNVHLGKLPTYRGGLSAFWILRFGDKEAGASIHKVDTGIDTGDVVEEVRLEVKTNSMMVLMQETVKETGPALVRAVEKFAANDWEAVDTSDRETAYYYMPTAKDFKEFYKRGCRLK